MSRKAEITLQCWDGEYSFRLRIGELIILQEKCDAGPAYIGNRLRDDTWKVQDIRETLRLGLIGAGTKQDVALSLVNEHVDNVPLADNVGNAYLVIIAAIFGVDDEQLGEAPAAKVQETDQESEIN